MVVAFYVPFPPFAKMGKKSKRRGGTGGGRKSRQTVGAGDAAAAATGAAGPTVTPADALALLETVQPPTSLKGIVSTNDDPGKCALCLSPAALFAPPSAPGVAFSAQCLLCCGKRFCNACEDADCGYALDLLGDHRCTFCNALKSRSTTISLQEATAQKTWAQQCIGVTFCALGGWPNLAFDYLVRAASQGHPEAFFRLSELCLGKYGHTRDLMAAQAFAKKARSFHPDLRLISNKTLLDIAKEYLEDGAVAEVMAILSDVAKEADPDALDGEVCHTIASLASRIDDYQLAGDMYARAFCHGDVKSALRASDSYTYLHRALCSLQIVAVCCL